MATPYNPQYPQGYSSSSPVYQQDSRSQHRSPYTSPAPPQHQTTAYAPPSSGPQYSSAEMASYQQPYGGHQRQQSPHSGANPSYYPPPSEYEHRNRFPTYQRPGTGVPQYYQTSKPNWDDADDDNASQYSSSSSRSGEKSRHRRRRRHSYDDTDNDNDKDRGEGKHDPFWEVRGPGPADGVRGVGAVLAGGAAGYWAGHKKGHGILGAAAGALAAELLEHEYTKHHSSSRRHRLSN